MYVWASHTSCITKVATASGWLEHCSLGSSANAACAACMCAAGAPAGSRGLARVGRNGRQMKGVCLLEFSPRLISSKPAAVVLLRAIN